MKKKLCWVVMLALSMSMLLTACSGSSGGMTSVSSTGYKGDYMNGLSYDSVSSGYDYASPEYAGPDAPESPSDKRSDRKLVRTASLSCEVKEYDGFIRWLENSVAGYGGYIENFSENQSQRYSPALYYSDYRNDFYQDVEAGYYMYRYAYMTIRVPAAYLDEFLNQIGDNANITSRNSRQSDITLSYVDVESYVKSLNVEQDRLLEIMADAENLEDILTIESRLSDIRRQLENYTSQLKLMDNQVDYATIDLDVSEVMDFTQMETVPTGYFGRLWLSFKRGYMNTWDFLVNLSFWLAENLVSLLLWAFVIFWCLKARKKWLEKHPRTVFRHNRVANRFQTGVPGGPAGATKPEPQAPDAGQSPESAGTGDDKDESGTEQ